MFVEQGQITGATRNGLHQRKPARQCGIGRATLRAGLDQRGQYLVKPMACAFRQGADGRRARKIAQPRVVRFGIGEAGLGQCIGIAVFRKALPVAGDVRQLHAPATRLQQAVERLRYDAAMQVEFGLETCQVDKAQAAGDALARQRRVGQGVHLLVGEHLHAVFSAAKETIGIGQ